MQNSGEAHHDLDDAVRALRRPASWPREREQVSRWARRLLADDSLLAVDVETTGLEGAYAVQIAAV
ncbi:3'-5' exonuclease, partial [Streptomyces sp. NPDC054775]